MRSFDYNGRIRSSKQISKAGILEAESVSCYLRRVSAVAQNDRLLKKKVRLRLAV